MNSCKAIPLDPQIYAALGTTEAAEQERIVRIVGLSESRAATIEDALEKDPFVPGNRWKGLHHLVEGNDAIVLIGEIDPDNPENLSGVAVGSVQGIVACPDPWVQRGLLGGYLTLHGDRRSLSQKSAVLSAVHVEEPARKRGVGTRLARAIHAEFQRLRMSEAIAMRSLKKRFAESPVLGDTLYSEKILQHLGYTPAGVASMSNLPDPTQFHDHQVVPYALKVLLERAGVDQESLRQMSQAAIGQPVPFHDLCREAIRPLLDQLGISFRQVAEAQKAPLTVPNLHQQYLDLHSNPERFEVWSCKLATPIARPTRAMIPSSPVAVRS